jgi:hypothetical protein
MSTSIRLVTGALGVVLALTVASPVAHAAGAPPRVHCGHSHVPRQVTPQFSVNGLPGVNRRSPSWTQHVDLTDLAPPVGDQGPVNSCASWVTSEYLYSLAIAAGMEVGPFAPMFLYSQLTQGVSVGTTLQQNLSIVESEGIEPASSYSLGPSNALLDYTAQPSASDRATAASYRLDGADWLFWVHADEQSIESWMSSTHRPVVFVLNLYHNVDDAGHTDADGVSYPLLIQPPAPGAAFRGSHIVIGYRTDADGVWFENSWGTGYGRNGWAELSWSFIQQQAIVYVLRSHGFANAEHPS